MMNNVIQLQTPLRMKLKELSDSVAVHTPLAIDNALSAERQLWRILSADYNDSKVYELALMVAAGNIEDSIKRLAEVRDRINEVLAKVAGKDLP